MANDRRHPRQEDGTRAAEVAAELSDVVYTLRLEPDLAFEYVSPAVEGLVGYTPADHYADPMLGAKLLDPRDADTLAGAAAAELGEPIEFTVRWRSKDGRIVWTAHRCRKQRREDGSIVLYGAARDVTAERELADRLTQTTEQLQLVLDNTADVIIRTAPDGTLLWASPSMRKVFGWDPEELVGTAARLAAPEFRQSVSDALEQAIESRDDRFAARLQVVCADGSLRWADTHNTLVWNGRGDVDSVVVVMRDVTDEVHAQQLLRRMLENATDVVFDMAPDNTCRWASPSVTEALGWTPQELVGVPGVDLVHPDDVAQVLAARQNPRAGLASVEALRYRRADGSYRWMSGVSREVRGDDGTLHGRVVGLRDVHETVLARSALADSERRYHVLAENASDVVYMAGPDQRLTWVSPAVERVLGWTPEELVGTRIADLLVPEVQASTQRDREVLFAGRNPTPDEGYLFQMRAKDGRYRWMSGRAVPLVDPDGTPRGMGAGLRDVTDLVEAEQVRHAVVDSLLDPHVLLQAIRDDTGTIVDFEYTDANAAACEYMQMTAAELVGARLLDLLPGQSGSGMLKMYADAVDSGNPLVLDDYAYPHEILQSERRYDIRAVRVGEALSFTWRDVTERHQIAADLSAAERRYRLLALNATDAVFVLDSTGMITWVSPAVQRVLGYQPAELVGVRTADIVHPEDLAELSSMATKVELGHEGVHWQVRVRTQDGDYRWMSAVSGPMIDPDGDVNGRITTMRDVHQQVLDRRALARSEETFRLAMEGAPEGMAVLGLHLAFQQVNPALCAMLGRTEDWLLSHTIRDVLSSESLESDLVVRDRLLAGEAEIDIHEARMVTSSGELMWVQHSVALVRDAHRMPLFYVSQYQDITDARAAHIDLTYRAHHDSLTGLINREQLQTRLGGILTRTPRQAGRPALLFCDLDRFKDINDSHGHEAGDYVLREVARRISTVLRRDDQVGRLGGDEFVVLLPEVANMAAAAEVAKQIRAAVAQPLRVGRAQVSITMSIGIAMATDGIEPHRLLRNADAALYEAKNSGRDRAVAFG